MKIVQFSRPPTPLVQLRPKFFHLLGFGRPLSPNENQSIKRKQSKDDYYMLSGLSFRSALVLSVKWLILSGFPLTSFHLAEGNVVPWPILRKLRIPFSRCSYSEKLSLGEDWAETSLTTFSWLYILVCAVVQKYRKMFYLLNLKTYINYGTTTAPCTWMNKIKQKQNKNQNKARHIQIEHAFYCLS